jgi:hypothetical protein
VSAATNLPPIPAAVFSNADPTDQAHYVTNAASNKGDS